MYETGMPRTTFTPRPSGDGAAATPRITLAALAPVVTSSVNVTEGKACNAIHASTIDTRISALRLSWPASPSTRGNRTSVKSSSPGAAVTISSASAFEAA
ncbi:Uncharacterised protein [Mycobacteroides abscessus]|nr:Uncharacterised protein [Mycobacteroides abscessus]